MDNIILDKVILHILDCSHDNPVLSERELGFDNEIHEFLAKHVTKVAGDQDIKEAVFLPEETEFCEDCRKLGQQDSLFVEISCRIAERLFTIMKQNPAIPSADLIVTTFKTGGVKYLGILKLNYRNSYIHYVSATGEGVTNLLIKQKTTLPGEGQKVDEFALINLADFSIKLLEKQYEVEGARELYWSKRFLKCNSDLSYKQKIRILDKTVSKISRRHQTEDFDKVSKLKSCLAETAEEAREIKINKVADAVFGHNTAFKEEYLQEVKKAGLWEESVIIPEAIDPVKKFGTQKLKTDSGIEINFPSEYYNDKDVIEFINNPDGTISILIKNISKVVNR